MSIWNRIRMPQIRRTPSIGTTPFLSLVVILATTAGAITAADVDADADPSSKHKPSNVPVTARKADVTVYPTSIKLSSARDFQSVVAVQQRRDGITVDVTDKVKWSVVKPAIAKIENGSVHPLLDGQTELLGRFGGSEFRIPITVTHADVDPAISFTADVMPVLTRAGCNTGSCHGAARGKDGFRLSLFGYDPRGDYQRITREIGVRRINLAVPAESLLLKKSVGAVPHTGGKLFDVDSDLYRTIHRWLREGAKMDDPKIPPPAVQSLTFDPPQAVIEGPGTQQRFVAIANLADGTTRDVTKLAAFTS
ncbi:MAG: cell surface protein, partial [Planctomycetota bacterium]